jgi:hypothetical protein
VPLELRALGLAILRLEFHKESKTKYNDDGPPTLNSCVLLALVIIKLSQFLEKSYQDEQNDIKSGEGRRPIPGGEKGSIHTTRNLVQVQVPCCYYASGGIGSVLMCR